MGLMAYVVVGLLTVFSGYALSEASVSPDNELLLGASEISKEIRAYLSPEDAKFFGDYAKIEFKLYVEQRENGLSTKDTEARIAYLRSTIAQKKNPEVFKQVFNSKLEKFKLLAQKDITPSDLLKVEAWKVN